MSNMMMQRAIKNLSALGAVPFYLFLTVFMLLIGNYSTFLHLLIGFAASYGIVIAIRSVYYRPRPKPENYSSIIEKIDASSFPSLHSLRITMMSVILVYSYNSLSSILFFSLVSIAVCYTRYYLKRHYFSDIIAGILIGLIEGFLIIYITIGLL